MSEIIVIQEAISGGMSGGRRGGVIVHGQGAVISMGGVIWTSPKPENKAMADFYNSAVAKIIQK